MDRLKQTLKKIILLLLLMGKIQIKKKKRKKGGKRRFRFMVKKTYPSQFFLKKKQIEDLLNFKNSASPIRSEDLLHIWNLSNFGTHNW